MKKKCTVQVILRKKDKNGKWYIAQSYLDTKGHEEKGENYEWVVRKLKNPVELEYCFV